MVVVRGALKCCLNVAIVAVMRGVRVYMKEEMGCERDILRFCLDDINFSN